jgi:hypothetical protein
MSPRSQTNFLPTDAELEAEAERERDRSRREAERILTQEAAERRRVEERMLELLSGSRGSPKESQLPPPPPRSQSMPNPPSPSPSQKEGSPSWWAAAKSKLISSKEPLTPAQQIIQETKLREKEEKRKAKGKEKEKDWPPPPSSPVFQNLQAPQTPQTKPHSLSPHSPTPSQSNLPHAPPPLTPSPRRSSDRAISPSGESTPYYAQFNAQGTLDVPGTLLVIARRFEKLEKWTVGHVRALEERMSDVERWLVDKEKEKEAATQSGAENSDDQPSPAALGKEVFEIRDEIAELQGRVGELGREMAKLVTAPGNLSSGPSRLPAQVTHVPQTSSSIAVRAQTPVRQPGTARESTSPPMSSVNSGSRTRLPYPSGDYATPPDTVQLGQGTFSPTSSPPSSITSATRTRPMSISGLPPLGITNSGAGLGILNTPPTLGTISGLPPPRAAAPRPSSVSPTPRKRYTVALGGPIVAPDERPPSPQPAHVYSSSPVGTSGDESDSAEDDEMKQHTREETIGKSLGARVGSGNGNGKNDNGGDNNRNDDARSANARYTPSPSPSPGSRIRPRSTYGLSSLALAPTTPLRPRLRSKSTDRLSSAPNTTGATTTAAITPLSVGKFVDPLSRRQLDKPGTGMAKALRGKKVGVGDLVAFFDGDK